MTRYVRVWNSSRNQEIATAAVATNPWSRFVGLMGRRTLGPGTGLLIRPCNAIHMFFMRMPLDVLHCGTGDAGGDVVLRVLAGIKPWRIGPIVRGSKYVIELPAGTAERTETQAGDILRIEPVEAPR